jgi:predicted RNA-binding protein with EMAP domain
MEQRIQNLEELCELITKQVVEQNKNLVEINQNLINEIRSLKAAYVKQDEDFEEFKNLLKKIHDQNRMVCFAYA